MQSCCLLWNPGGEGCRISKAAGLTFRGLVTWCLSRGAVRHTKDVFLRSLSEGLEQAPGVALSMAVSTGEVDIFDFS